MNRPEPNVVIVGAGPTGLLLAGDLAAAGVEVTVLEKRDGQSNLTRAFAVHARTMETLDMRGVAAELAATGSRASEFVLLGRARLRLSRLPSRFPYLLVTPQYETERVLRRRAEEHGARFEFGAAVTGLRQDAEGVELTVDTARGVETRNASYVVGTDGVRSVVRQRLGLPFPGRLAAGSIMLADVRMAEPPKNPVAALSNQHGFVFVAPFGDGWYRVIGRRAGDTTADDVPVDFAEVRELVRAVFGADFGMNDPRWTSRIHSDERQVPRYRVGRVFLAGDAAHVHSPAGGQGMNTGLQDSANLGWKLAAVVKGRADARLLDSYHDERHPIGSAVVRGSGMLLRMAQLRNGLVRAVRNTLFATVLRTPIGDRVARTVSGIAVGYPAPRGADGSVGSRIPDLALTGGDGEPTRLFEALRGGRFVLVTRGEGPAVPAALSRWVDTAVAAEPVAPTLVRPDGYIAWRGDADATPNWSDWLTADPVERGAEPR